MVVILVEPAGALLQRSLELRGNTLEPYSCEVLASYSAAKLAEMGYPVDVYCCDDEDQRREPYQFRPTDQSNGKKVSIHVLQHGRKTVEDQDLASKIIDLLAEGEAPYVVGLSVRTYAYMKSLVLSAILKSRKKDIQIVLGGYHPSVSCNEETKGLWKGSSKPEFLAPVDYQVIGEGEKPLTALLGKFLEIDDGKIANALGIKEWVVRNVLGHDATEHGRVIGGDEWRLEQDEFATAHQPVRNMSLIRNWCRNWNLSYPSPSKQTGVFQVQFTRGCSHSTCKFCCTPYVFGRHDKVRHKEPKNLVAEILSLRRMIGTPPNFAYFNDVTFNSSGDYWRDLCKAIILQKLHAPHAVKGQEPLVLSGEGDSEMLEDWLSRNANELNNTKFQLDIPVTENVKANLHWFALCRGDAISIEDALLLAASGCSKVGIGMESFSEDVANGLGKKCHRITGKSYTESITESLTNTDRVGIINRVYIILGSPNESLESLHSTWAMLEKHPVDQIRVAFYVPYVTDEQLLDGIERTALSEDRPNIRVPQLEKRLEDMDNIKDVMGPLRRAIDNVKEEGCKDIQRRLASFLCAFRKSFIENFYKSEFYEKRARDKVRRYPHLRNSYQEFFVELFETSGCRIDVRHYLDDKKG